MDFERFPEIAAASKKALVQAIDEIIARDLPDIDALVEQTEQQVWKEVDCTACAICCKTMSPVLTQEDINRIALYLRLKPKDFQKKYLIKEGDTGNWVNNATPCVFLNDNLCTIYGVRPDDCAGFPHHDKRPFAEYAGTYRKNINRCPATFRLIERLKEATDAPDS